MSLPIGRGTFTERQLKVHHYDGSLRVTDMRNAGKRGQKVSEFSVQLRSPRVGRSLGREKSNEILEDAAGFIMPMDFEEALAWFKTNPDLFDVTRSEHRGVDVPPAATRIELNYRAAGGGIIDLSAGPWSFRVKSSAPLTNLKTGAPSGYFNDTSYYGRKKADGQVFYAWLQSHLSQTSGMTIGDYRDLWRSLGIEYDYQ